MEKDLVPLIDIAKKNAFLKTDEDFIWSDSF
jgi:hypothetical protein